jgi:cytochrome c biogenesis protein CcdA
MEQEEQKSKIPQLMRNIFGVIMILIYLGMGVLFLIGAFPQLSGSFEWLRWVGGVILIIYGFWRAYRQFKSIDPDITTRY